MGKKISASSATAKKVGEKTQGFLPPEKIKLLVVCGPTASGKTRLSIDIAKRFDGEIIGADSMQLYRGMNIGTAKPDAAEMQGIPHHLIDFLEPDENFSVAAYVGQAKKIIAEISMKNRLPIVCGGTGLYISSLVDGVGFEGVKSDIEFRESLKRLSEEKGAEYLHKRLEACDPELAQKLHPNNLGRVIRALEVYELSGVTMTELQKRSRQKPPEYDLCMLGICYGDRQKLYERINLRVDMMLRDGLIEEAKALFESGFSGTASQAIGYKELKKYFEGGESLEEAAENIKRETRRYAKRQMTWLKRDERIRWLCGDKYEEYAYLLKEAESVVQKFLFFGRD